MAWYDITYSCGHQGREQIIGKLTTRDWIIKNKSDGLCPDCYKQHIQELRKAENKKSAEINKEYGLPELIGTPKQVEWGETCRKNKIERMEHALETETIRSFRRMDDERKKVLLEKYRLAAQRVMMEESAAWWIDHRGMSGGDIRDLLDKHIKAMENEVTGELEVEKMIEAEITVRPEDPKTETVAFIKFEDETIEINFPERREDFRQIVKGRGFEWNGLQSCWIRKITIFSGPVLDRVAEVGHLLLGRGFVVRIPDMTAREMAVTGQYQKEQTRWIKESTSDKYKGSFAISWNRDREDLYDVARQLPGSRWDRTVVTVPPERFEEVLDFAGIYGFKLSQAALNVVERARAIKEASLVARVEVPREGKVHMSSAIPILQVPDEVTIDEELRDDD